jgi:hypothetical protein
MNALNPKSIARALGGVAKGDSVLAPGPGHSAKDRSLSVKADSSAPDGFVVFSHAGDDPIKCRDYVRERCGEPAWQPRGSKGAGDRANNAVYVYRDERGEPYAQVSRYYRDGTKQFAQSHWTGKAWAKGTTGLPKIPYLLPELLARPDSPIFVCEGEKDADRLTSHGLVSTTASEGAGKWRAELDKWFAGRTVYVLPDNDKPGRDHANTVGRHLSPIAKAIRVVALPGLPDKGDVSDWLNAGNDVPALVAIAEAAPPWAANDNTAPHDATDDTIDADTLLGMDFPALAYVVPGYVVEGLTVLGGKPKLGKSWWAYDIGIAVATGARAMGQVQCEQGDVLYLALEDNWRRVKNRINVVRPLSRKWGGLSRLKVRTIAPRIDSGLIDELEKWRSTAANPRLIIIDVYMKVRPLRKRGEDAYAADYAAVMPLQQYASQHRIAILLVTHTRKMEAEDPLESISGTNGVTGAADAVLVLGRDARGYTLYGRGRDIEEIETALKFNGGQWTILGNADEVRKSGERRKVLAALKERLGEPVGPKAIADATGMKAGNLRVLLRTMVAAGEIAQPNYGLYTLITPITPVTLPSEQEL